MWVTPPATVAFVYDGVVVFGTGGGIRESSAEISGAAGHRVFSEHWNPHWGTPGGAGLNKL